MVKYREIIRLGSMGLGHRDIAHSCGCAKTTVSEVLKRAKEKGLCWPLADELSDTVIREKIYPKTEDPDDYLVLDYEHLQKELSRRGVTRQLLWDEYCKQAESIGATPYSYTRFCEKLREWSKAQGVTLHIEHRAAESIQVDWVGMFAEVYDVESGEILKVYVFVATLPFSGLIYAEGFFRCDERAWIDAHVHTFNFFGGTAPVLTPDNCRTAVTKHTKEKLILNDQYRRLAEHYNVVIVPTRPRKPKDKGACEMAVRLVEQLAMAPLRDMRFFSLSEFNEALKAKVDQINRRPFQKRPGSRQEIFDDQEKEYLQDLPPVPFEMIERKICRVQINYHISFDKRNYSIPYEYIGKEVEVVATSHTVTILYNGAQIAVHKRSFGPNESYITQPTHMPDAHKAYVPWSAERFVKWALGVGPATKDVVSAILKSRAVEQHAYKSANALLHLADNWGKSALERACTEALARTTYPSYKLVKSLIGKHTPDVEDDLDDSAYLRGASYYENL